MGIQNQIKSKLLEMEGGKFQRLCDDWLYRKGLKNINPIGMMTTTDRVVKGTPDCLFMQSNGKYIFSEYTVQQERLAKKLEDDISKCFDEIKTNIPIDKISEIIICHLGRLTTEEISKLRKLCYDRGIMLTLYGLDSISLSIKNSYPVISETYLNLPLDTGQLLNIEDFIHRYGKSNFTTPIDNELLFCDDLLTYAQKTLETTKFLLISGAAGLGKTLFSVTLAKKIQQENNNLNVICLFDKGADLVRDITAHFSEPGDYLIFVDDANRLDNRLDYLLHYLNENDNNRTFRIIATVRDYARTSVIDKVKKYTNIHEQIITALTDEQIKELSESIFGIKNVEYQKRIQDISCGNPRLAIMASRIAVETNQIQSIQNVTALYKDYFEENENVKQVINDDKLIATACVISFFRKVDKLNERQNGWIRNSFGIQPEEFWENVAVLHTNEIVDLHEGEVVKISDQILSTYLFYIAVFDKKVVPFSSIVNEFYPDYTRTIVDSLNPVISAFDQNKVVAEIRNEIKEIFNSFSERKSIQESIEFLNMFWFALPTESLLFAARLIEEMPIVEVDWGSESFEESEKEPSKSSLVSLLTNFRHHGEHEFKISFDLLLKYLLKEKNSLGYVVRSLLQNYNFKPDDWRYGYYVQAHIIDTITSQMFQKEGYLFSRIFILIAKSFLKVERREHQWFRGDSINIITFRLHPDKYLLPLREKMFSTLTTLAENTEFEPFVIDCFKEYVDRIGNEGKEMVEADITLIEKYLIKTLNKICITHCMIMQDYCSHLESLNLNFPDSWKHDFFNETLTLSNLILESRNERRMLEMDYEEYCQYRYKSLVEYFLGYSMDDFVNFIEKCKVLHNVLSGRDRNYSLKRGMEMCLRALADAAPNIYPDFILKYLEYDDHFAIDPHYIIGNLFKTISSKNIMLLLNSKEYRLKNWWMSIYFAQLPEKDITENESELLLKHIFNVSSDEAHGTLDYLSKYKHVDSKIYSKVVSLLINKAKVDKNHARPLGQLFSNHSPMFGKWFDELLLDDNLVFDAYLAAFELERYWDYNGKSLKLLLNKRFDFLYDLVDKIYEMEMWPDVHTSMPELDFLWDRENYIEEIECYAKYIHHKSAEIYRYSDSIFSKLFPKEESKDTQEEYYLKKISFFRASIIKNAVDIKFIRFIYNTAKHLNEDSRRELLKIFLDVNPKIEDFHELDYELTTQIWSGSRVPILNRERAFLESLLPLFNSVKFLEHKYYVEKQIEEKSKHIEQEKKRDYMESR